MPEREISRRRKEDILSREYGKYKNIEILRVLSLFGVFDIVFYFWPYFHARYGFHRKNIFLYLLRKIFFLEKRYLKLQLKKIWRRERTISLSSSIISVKRYIFTGRGTYFFFSPISRFAYLFIFPLRK